MLQGSKGFRTMRVKGMHGKWLLYILIDSGSTHNFVNEQLAHKIGYLLRKTVK